MKRFHLYGPLLMALFLLGSLWSPAKASDSHAEKVDVKEIVLGHMSDAYAWHIINIDGKHYSIPLPVIVRSEVTGEWHVFSSTRIEEAGEKGDTYLGFFFNEEKNGKIYERLTDGSVVRPYDFSITKNVVQIWIVALLLIIIFMVTARWYKVRDAKSDAPRGFVGAIEMLVTMINDDVIKSSIGEKHYRKYAPYLLTVFFFIFTTNVLGLIPIFPGGANVTGNINITFFLAFCTMIAINLFGNKEYWKEIFWPEVPTFLKFPIPIMPVIEMFGVLTKPFALMIRLFANMMAGHAIILAFVSIIFITMQVSIAIGSCITVLSGVMLVFMNCLECIVAFVQAYVFTMLSAVFIGLSVPEHHTK